MGRRWLPYYWIDGEREEENKYFIKKLKERYFYLRVIIPLGTQNDQPEPLTGKILDDESFKKMINEFDKSKH